MRDAVILSLKCLATEHNRDVLTRSSLIAPAVIILLPAKKLVVG